MADSSEKRCTLLQGPTLELMDGREAGFICAGDDQKANRRGERHKIGNLNGAMEQHCTKITNGKFIN